MLIRVALLFGLVALLAGACSSGDSPPSTPTRTTTTVRQPVSTPSGPRIVLDPTAGPPGIEVTVTGSGWAPGVLVDITGALAPGVTADPYKSILSSQDGSFSTQFRLEKKPDGTDLSTGRYDLIARSKDTEVTVPFIVETRRPVGSSAPGG